MQFHLMSNGERSVICNTEQREFLDIHQRDGRWAPRGRVEAGTWLDAKNGLGFELTLLQRTMLPLDRAGRELLQRRSA